MNDVLLNDFIGQSDFKGRGEISWSGLAFIVRASLKTEENYFTDASAAVGLPGTNFER
jgi:hypothetical protein